MSIRVCTRLPCDFPPGLDSVLSLKIVRRVLEDEREEVRRKRFRFAGDRCEFVPTSRSENSSADIAVSAIIAVSLPPFGYPPTPSPLLPPAPTAAGCGVPDEVVVSDNEMSLVSAIP
jgi:hypothetical protein